MVQPDRFAIGYLDGGRAARVDILNDVRSEVNRFHCVITNLLEIIQVEGAPEPYVMPEIRPDNPDGDTRYAAGFEQGYDNGYEVDHKTLRKNLNELELYLGPSGRVMTDEMVGAFVDIVRDFMAPVRAETIDDAALHRALDRGDHRDLGFDPPGDYDVEADLAGRYAGNETGDTDVGAPVSGEGQDRALNDLIRKLLAALPVERRPLRTADSTLLQGVESQRLEPMRSQGRPADRPKGAWTVFKSVISRRRALVAYSGGVVSTALAFLALTTVLATPEPTTVQPPQWVPPTIWDHQPLPVKNRYLAIDEWIFGQEKSTGVPAPGVIAAINIAMSLQGSGVDMIKQIVAGYIRDTNRVAYLSTLVSTLDPANSSTSTRRTVLTTVDGVWKNAVSTVLRSVILASLRSYQNSGLENDPYSADLLDRVIKNVER